ncbi:MAG: hypothetical protein ABIC68_00315 [Candidatus Omnitrophota bacterium]
MEDGKVKKKDDFVGRRQKTENRGWNLSGLGQASLELSAALILVAMLIVGAIKIFVWLNGRLVMRQVAYEQSRVAAGSAAHERVNIYDQSATKGVQVDDSGYEALNLF